MKAKRLSVSAEELPVFSRRFFDSDEVLTCIGSGVIGGKASGLAFIKDTLATKLDRTGFPQFDVSIPRLAVIATDAFDDFMERNKLYGLDFASLTDSRIARVFQEAALPAELVGDLRSVAVAARQPLAIRSSSLLEDAMYEPFAGVYATKMIPNNQADIDRRFRALVEAVKFVYASTFFKAARDYAAIVGKSIADEKMAVIVQEIIGRRFADRFYPHISGVARSFNYYPTGRAKPEDGVVTLALGLGKTIVDGGLAWSYSPTYPRLSPPTGSAAELLKVTQSDFWAVHMGPPPEHDPIRETEYLYRADLATAERDGALRHLASTYRPQDDRLVAGTGPDGPRVMTFAPILCDKALPLNDLLRELLRVCEAAVGSPVEIEFAVTLGPRDPSPARLGFLQVRPMVVSQARIDLTDDEMSGNGVLASSDRVLGNGVTDTIADVVYVRPDRFESRHTRTIGLQLDEINRSLVGQGRRYLLVGFGRWGSSDQWLGIPVDWSSISGAGAIVEATLETMNVDLSQGSHFFHNISSFQISYFMVHHESPYRIDWTWLDEQPRESETEYVRHIRLSRPLTIKVDGRTGRGVILK